MMNGKKLFQENLRHIQDMKLNETKATLSDLIMKEEIKRVKRVEAVKKCNVKRYASLKAQKELEAENKALIIDNERLERELKEIKQLKGFKESKQVKEIKTEGGYFDIDDVPEYEDLDNEKKYTDEIEKLLCALGKHIGFEDDLTILYLDILRENGLKQAKKYPIAEKREKEYKKIIEAIKNEFD
jgi:hypothetical protein